MQHFNCWRSVPLPCGQYMAIFSSVRSSNSHSDQLLTHPHFSDHSGPQYWTFTFWAMLDIKLILVMYIVEYLFKYFIKQMQVKIKIVFAGSGMWSCLFQSWRWQVSKWWQQCLIFDVLEILWMYQGHNDMFKMRRSLQSGRRFLWCWAWQVRGPWNVSVDVVSWRKKNALLSPFIEIPTINHQVQRYRGDNQCNGHTRG